MVKVGDKSESDTKIKDVAWKVLKEHLKIYVKTKADAVSFPSITGLIIILIASIQT